MPGLCSCFGGGDTVESSQPQRVKQKTSERINAGPATVNGHNKAGQQAAGLTSDRPQLQPSRPAVQNSRINGSLAHISQPSGPVSPTYTDVNVSNPMRPTGSQIPHKAASPSSTNPPLAQNMAVPAQNMAVPATRPTQSSGSPAKIAQTSSNASVEEPEESPASFRGFLTERDMRKSESANSVDWPPPKEGQRIAIPSLASQENRDLNGRMPSPSRGNFAVSSPTSPASPPLSPASVASSLPVSPASIYLETDKAEITAIKNRRRVREERSGNLANSFDSDSSNSSFPNRAGSLRQQELNPRYRHRSSESNGSLFHDSFEGAPSRLGSRTVSEASSVRGMQRPGLSSVRESDSGARPASLYTTKSGSLSGAPGETGQAGADLYELVGSLGQGNGSTGVMKLMRDKRTRDLVAAKWVQHTQGEVLSVQLEREIVNHRRLLHSNIIRFREVFATDEYLVIVMDYASIGPLSERIAEGGPLPEESAKLLFRQVVDGMVYCHKQGVVHRNLTLKNLLLDGHALKPIVKISGFAYSKAPDLDSAPKSAVTAPMFLSPEVLRGAQRGDRYDGRASDVWACGIILFNILTGKLPFQDENDGDLRAAIRTTQRILECAYSLPKHLHLTAEVKDLLQKIFVPDPIKRIDSYALTAHPWLSGASLPVPKTEAVLMSTQTESDISAVMERARKRRAARLAAQREKSMSPENFNEDLLNDY